VLSTPKSHKKSKHPLAGGSIRNFARRIADLTDDLAKANHRIGQLEGQARRMSTLSLISRPMLVHASVQTNLEASN
jgi:hypothetical protein